MPVAVSISRGGTEIPAIPVTVRAIGACGCGCSGGACNVANVRAQHIFSGFAGIPPYARGTFPADQSDPYWVSGGDPDAQNKLFIEAYTGYDIAPNPPNQTGLQLKILPGNGEPDFPAYHGYVGGVRYQSYDYRAESSTVSISDIGPGNSANATYHETGTLDKDTGVIVSQTAEYHYSDYLGNVFNESWSYSLSSDGTLSQSGSFPLSMPYGMPGMGLNLGMPQQNYSKGSTILINTQESMELTSVGIAEMYGVDPNTMLTFLLYRTTQSSHQQITWSNPYRDAAAMSDAMGMLGGANFSSMTLSINGAHVPIPDNSSTVIGWAGPSPGVAKRLEYTQSGDQDRRIFRQYPNNVGGVFFDGVVSAAAFVASTARFRDSQQGEPRARSCFVTRSEKSPVVNSANAFEGFNNGTIPGYAEPADFTTQPRYHTGDFVINPGDIAATYGRAFLYWRCGVGCRGDAFNMPEACGCMDTPTVWGYDLIPALHCPPPGFFSTPYFMLITGNDYSFAFGLGPCDKPFGDVGGCPVTATWWYSLDDFTSPLQAGVDQTGFFNFSNTGTPQLGVRALADISSVAFVVQICNELGCWLSYNGSFESLILISARANDPATCFESD